MSAILFFRKQNSLPNIMLAFILILPSLNYINNYLILSDKLYLWPSVIFFSQIGALICSALIYQYSKLFMGKKSLVSIILHVITAIMVTYCLIHYLIFLSQHESVKTLFIQNILKAVYPQYLIHCRGAFFLLLNSYFLLMLYELRKHSKKIFNVNSDLELIKLRYLQKFVLLIWLLNIGILSSYLLIQNYYVDFVAVPLITNVFYIFILKTGFNHAAIFKESEFVSFEKRLKTLSNIKQSCSVNIKFEDNEAEQIQKRINNLINDKKIFTDPEINIIKLSKLLGITVHHTSYFINNYLNTNFYNLINSKRIELAKEKMDIRGINSEIEVIGFESGFNSKSAFYRAFKRYVNLSPSEYISKKTNNRRFI
ncbi:MAG: AraC family transcriptional regulator [Bacteroidales bacterium]|nr:AraC family transcriptional regulator [Bacteroidales bacterium]